VLVVCFKVFLQYMKSTVPWGVMICILLKINRFFFAATIFIAVEPEDGENRFLETFRMFPPDNVA